MKFGTLLHYLPGLFGIVSVIGFTGLSGCTPETKTHKEPNIILCMSDDQGWGDAGFHGHPFLKTDVTEDKNVIDEYPEIARSMINILNEWIGSTKNSLEGKDYGF